MLQGVTDHVEVISLVLRHTESPAPFVFIFKKSALIPNSVPGLSGGKSEPPRVNAEEAADLLVHPRELLCEFPYPGPDVDAGQSYEILVSGQHDAAGIRSPYVEGTLSGSSCRRVARILSRPVISMTPSLTSSAARTE